MTRQQAISVRKPQQHSYLVRDMQYMGDAEIVRKYGHLRIGYRVARQGGCCAKGTRAFIGLVHRMYQQTYGKTLRRGVLTVRELYALRAAIEAHTMAFSYWLPCAIAAAAMLAEEPLAQANEGVA